MDFFILFSRSLSNLLFAHGTRGWQESLLVGWAKTQEKRYFQLPNHNRSHRFITRRRILCWKTSVKHDGYAIHCLWWRRTEQRPKLTSGMNRLKLGIGILVFVVFTMRNRGTFPWLTKYSLYHPLDSIKLQKLHHMI